MRVVKFAQGEFLMPAMHGSPFAAGLIGWTGLVRPTLGAYAGIFLTIPVIVAFGALVHRLLLSHVTEREGGSAAVPETNGRSTIHGRLSRL